MAIKFRNLFAQDIDYAFQYKTDIELVVQDKYIGIPIRVLQILLLIYFLYYSLIDEQDFFKKEFSTGYSLYHSTGSGEMIVDKKKTSNWDNIDVQEPAIDNNALFIVTKESISKNQKRGHCVDYSQRCIKNSDCNENFQEKCSDGYCIGFNWCPESEKQILNQYNISDKYVIWFRSFISFPILQQQQNYETITSQNITLYPENNANTFTLRNLLEISNPSINEKNIIEQGGILKVNIIWSCLADKSSCTPQISVKRVDQITSDSYLGFRTIKYKYSLGQNGESLRNMHNMTGIRLIINTQGQGKSISFQKIMFQIAILIAVFQIPSIVGDLILLYLSRSNSQYKEYKYEYHTGLEDYAREIEIEEEQKFKNREKEQQDEAKHAIEFEEEEKDSENYESDSMKTDSSDISK